MQSQSYSEAMFTSKMAYKHGKELIIDMVCLVYCGKSLLPNSDKIIKPQKYNKVLQLVSFEFGLVAFHVHIKGLINMAKRSS